MRLWTINKWLRRAGLVLVLERNTESGEHSLGIWRSHKYDAWSRQCQADAFRRGFEEASKARVLAQAAERVDINQAVAVDRDGKVGPA